MKSFSRFSYGVVMWSILALVLIGCPTEEDDTYSGPTGTVEGTVSDATTGDLLAGVSVTIQGYSQFGATSDDFGAFSITSPTGVQTLILTLSGYAFPPAVVEVFTGETTDVSDGLTSGSPDLTSGQIRIVLSWGDLPSDLDSHLLTPSGDEVYYSNPTPSGAGANLDRDDVNSYGPETITITGAQAGTYVYFVYNFSGSPDITDSDAIVQFYDSSGLVNTLSVPTSGSGLYWNVMSLESDGAGNFTPTYTNEIQIADPAG